MATLLLRLVATSSLFVAASVKHQQLDQVVTALAPALRFAGAAPTSAAASKQSSSDAATRWGGGGGGMTCWVDCDHGDDTNAGTSRSHPLRTLQAARARIRTLRRTKTAPVQTDAAGTYFVNVLPGVCYLDRPLKLGAVDSHTVWRAVEGTATISGGRPLSGADWSPVNWPGAAPGSVMRAQLNASAFPIDVQSLRVGNQTVPRSRYPPAQNDYRRGWLFAAPFPCTHGLEWSGVPTSAGRTLATIAVDTAQFSSAAVYETSPTDIYVNFFAASERDIGKLIVSLRFVLSAASKIESK